MNILIKKASAVIMAMLMVTSFSSCSGLNSNLSDPVNTTTKKSVDSKDTKSTGKDSVGDDDIVGLTETNYNKGIELLKTGKFSEAKALFEKCGNYKYASDLVIVCNAENEFYNGHYNSAIAYYARVSERVEVPGFWVQRKKANISTRISLVKMTGTYYPSSNTITMKKYKKKRMVGGWHSTGIWSPQFITLSYTENSDGTFNVNGYVQFMRYTKYAKKRSGIKTGVYKLPLNLKHITRFPNSLKLAKGVTLTYKNGVFVVNYSKTTKKGKNKVVYKSKVTYKKS